MKLSELIAEVTAKFRFTAAKYPQLAGADPDETRDFAVRHVAHHLAKTAGAVAAEAERSDHGGQIDGEAIRKAAAKSLINALTLANAVKMSEEEVIDAVRRELNKPINEAH